MPLYVYEIWRMHMHCIWYCRRQERRGERLYPLSTHVRKTNMGVNLNMSATSWISGGWQENMQVHEHSRHIFLHPMTLLYKYMLLMKRKNFSKAFLSSFNHCVIELNRRMNVIVVCMLYVIKVDLNLPGIIWRKMSCALRVFEDMPSFPETVWKSESNVLLVMSAQVRLNNRNSNI